MIEAEFGMDWKEEYVVWDPACGTGNLTRDYKFKELYLSTINEEDIGIANQRGYNPEAVKFQFDFLNDPDEKFPEGLKKALEEKKPIIVFMNPPYGIANDIIGKKSLGKGTSMGKNKVNSDMISLNLGKASQQLYIQFLFRCYQISELYNNNFAICIYTVPTFLTTITGNKFRKLFLNKFGYKRGSLFNAGHFSNVSSNWGISITLWLAGKMDDRTNFNFLVKNMLKGKPVTTENKLIYNLDETISCSLWAKEYLKRENMILKPHMTSGLKIAKNYHMKVPEDSIGHIINNGNNVYSGHISSGLFSSIGTCGGGVIGFPVTKDNFDRVLSLFVARQSIPVTWINQKDEYMAPNTEHPDYEQWNNDCLIYSLFNNSSNQSSLRSIDYKDKKWDIINEWFWMSVEDMRELAEEHKFDELYADCRNFAGERFIYKKLPETKLSDDAGLVYNKAVDLVTESFKYREMLYREHPEYHLNTWDAGWYQIKLILKQFMLDDLKEFRKLYKEFEDRMRKGVYKFGFLK